MPPGRRSEVSVTKRHLGELDVIRTLTIAGVVLVHSVGLTGLYFGASGTAGPIDAAVVLLHYTRETFMFLTGLVLAYQYHDRDITTWNFWARRFTPTVIPYVFWSILYILSADLQVHESFGLIFRHIWVSLLLCTASYQLYYMLVTFQFYIIFPVLLFLFRRHTDWRTWMMLASAAFTTAWYIFLGPANVHPAGTLWPFGSFYQSHFVMTYIFFFVLGMWAAFYLDEITAFMKRYRRILSWSVLAMALVLEGRYVIGINLTHESYASVTTVLQPIMIPYSVAIIVGSYLVPFALDAWGRVGRRITAGFKRFADNSFGIYLMHVFFISLFLKQVDPRVQMPLPLLMLVTWLVSLTVSFFITEIMAYLPLLGWLVGRGRSGGRQSARQLQPEVSS